MTITATGQLKEGDVGSPYDARPVTWDPASLSPLWKPPSTIPLWDCKVQADPERGISHWNPRSSDLHFGDDEIGKIASLLKAVSDSLPPSAPSGIADCVRHNLNVMIGRLAIYRTVKAVKHDLEKILTNAGIYRKGESEAMREYRTGPLQGVLDALDKLHAQVTAIIIKDEDPPAAEETMGVRADARPARARGADGLSCHGTSHVKRKDSKPLSRKKPLQQEHQRPIVTSEGKRRLRNQTLNLVSTYAVSSLHGISRSARCGCDIRYRPCHGQDGDSGNGWWLQPPAAESNKWTVLHSR